MAGKLKSIQHQIHHMIVTMVYMISLQIVKIYRICLKKEILSLQEAIQEWASKLPRPFLHMITMLSLVVEISKGMLVPSNKS